MLSFPCTRGPWLIYRDNPVRAKQQVVASDFLGFEPTSHYMHELCILNAEPRLLLTVPCQPDQVGVKCF